MYPDLLIHRMGQADFVYLITPKLFQKGIAHPDYLRLGLVCTAVSHRMNRTRNNLSSDQLRSLEETLLHYHGAIIRSLSRDIGEQDTQPRDTTIAGIITLLLADVSRVLTVKGRQWQSQIADIIHSRPSRASSFIADGISKAYKSRSCCAVASDLSMSQKASRHYFCALHG